MNPHQQDSNLSDNKELDEILDKAARSLSRTGRKNPYFTKKEAKQEILALFATQTESIKREVLKCLPDEVTLEMNKYHHQTQIDGYNQAIKEIRESLSKVLGEK